MKPFISSLFMGLFVLAACNNPAQEPAAPAEESVPSAPTVQVQVSTQPAVVAIAQTPAPTRAESPKPAPTKSAAASVKTPDEVVLRLKAWDKKLDTLQTEFVQTTEYDGVQISSSQGKLTYRKNGHLLRLDSFSAEKELEQSALTDKQTILILDDAGQQVTTLSWDEWQQGQPNQALFDFGNYTALLEKHTVSLPEPNVLKLTPKEGEEYELYLTLSEADFFPKTIKIVSDLMVTRADLKNIRKNQPLTDTTFGGFVK